MAFTQSFSSLSLEKLLTPEFLLRDSDGDGIADGVAAVVLLGEENDAAANAGGAEIALRLGLAAAGLTLPIARTDAEPPPPGRPLVILGPRNRYLETEAVPPELRAQGAGYIYLDPAGVVVVSGPGPRETLDAARWLAAGWPGVAPDLTLAQMAARAGAPLVGAVVALGGAGLLELWCRGPAGLVRCYTAPAGAGAGPPAAIPGAMAVVPDGAGGGAADPAGLDQLFAEEANLQFWIDPETTAGELAALANLAARAGVEATAAVFPVCRLPGEPARPGALQVRLGEPAAAGATPVERSPSPAGAGGSLVWEAEGRLTVRGSAGGRRAALDYLAGHFPCVGGWGLEYPRLAGLNAAGPVEEREEPGREPALAFAREWQDEWEVHRFYRIWRGRVLPRLAPGQPARVDLRLSEPRPVREALAAELRADLAALGVQASVHVRSAFKQGFHWLEEEILPRLREAGPVARVQIAFRRFRGEAPPGERVLDLPIRWLQELYPIDEVLAPPLGLSPDAVTFAMVEEGPTYRVTAYAHGGTVVLDETFTACAAPRRYMEAYPELGWVHPPTGLLQVEQNGAVLLRERIATDPERFWDFYQGEILPRLRAAIVEQHGARPDPSRQPLFAGLQIEVALSEDDRRLEIREERISPLDALHEDLYFFTLDYLANLGRELCGTPFNALGAVLPWVRRSEGGPGARIALSRWGQAAPAGPATPATPALPAAPATPAFPDHGPPVHPPAHAPLDLGPPAPEPVPLTSVIGPDQLRPYLARLARRPGVRVWQAGTSFAGRPCYALEVRAPTPEAICPPRKITAMKPVLLINARHHANEVSSTNAALRLVELATGDDPEIQGWLRHVVLVLNPLENMDGAAIHYRMMAEHPTWKLHAARFNAVGLEFYSEYANPNTPYGEARVLPALFAQYRPDILLDDHGVPSHEWLQPFSGYNSAPYFRVSYWLPNAVLYGIFRAVNPEEYPAQAAATRALRDLLAQRVAADSELSRWNRLWLERYEKYGHRWLPDRFPLELHQGMIQYTWPARPDSFGARFPQWCVVDWVTEVPDETAQGEHLQLCVHAHLAAHRATLEFLSRNRQPVRHRCRAVLGGLRWEVGRERPLQLTAPAAGPVGQPEAG